MVRYTFLPEHDPKTLYNQVIDMLTWKYIVLLANMYTVLSASLVKETLFGSVFNYLPSIAEVRVSFGDICNILYFVRSGYFSFKTYFTYLILY